MSVEEIKFDHTKEKHVAMQLVKRPVGLPTDENVTFVETPLRELADGEILIKVEYVSIDPTHRIWMTNETSYLPPVGLNETFRSLGSGVVVLSKHKDFQPGDKVSGLLSIQNFVIGKPEELRLVSKLPSFVSLTSALDYYGINGLTAYFGLLDIGKPKKGENVLVSGAAGAVGCVAGQIAKALGCKVVGIAGSDDKCAWLTKELGFDGAINYKKFNTNALLKAELEKHFPTGIDIFFDNVGGDILDTTLEVLAMKARIVICGAISQYNNDKLQGITNTRFLLFKRARMEGFIFTDYMAKLGEALADLKKWADEGKVKVKPPHIEEGLRNYVKVLAKLFDGSNTGKLMIKVSH